MENITHLRANIPEGFTGKIAIISDAAHIKRVAMMMEKEGIEAELIDAESTLHESGPRRILTLLEKFEHSPKYELLRAKEKLSRLILVVDKNDYVHKLYAMLTRR